MNVIGAVRPYNFAKELSNLGFQVTCVTGELESGKTERDINFDICRVECGAIECWNKNRVQKGRNVQSSAQKTATYKKPNRAIAVLRRTAAQVLTVCEAIEWSSLAVKKCVDIINEDKPDLIFTTYGPLDTVLVGLKLKKRFKNIKWVSDMRDAMDAEQQQWWRKKLFSIIQNKMLKNANAVVTVCRALAKKYTLILEKYKKNTEVFVVENGYEEIPTTTLPIKDGVLRIGYTGSLYGGLRKMDALFDALSFLERKFGEEVPVKVCYAGTDGAELLYQAKKYNAEKYVVDYGMVDRVEALHIQETSDILCVLSWNTKKEQGILTGKFPEYLRLKKPVLALIDGDMPNSELTERINELNMGFSYEYINKTIDFIKFAEWLKNAVLFKKENKNVCPNIKLELLEEYSYTNLSKKLLETLNGIVSK
jgi:hypothetical protein